MCASLAIVGCGHEAHEWPSTPTTVADGLPFDTVDSPTPYSGEWNKALACWGVQGREPMVEIVAPEVRNKNGDEGFACAGSPTGYCTGTIRNRRVVVTPNLKALGHEFAHASHWYLDGGYGGHGNGCAGVAR